VAYREFAAPPELQSHVACLWIRDDAPSAGRVIPDGCADLVWTGDDLIVAGPSTQPFEPSMPGDGVKFGVRFRVGAAGAGLGLPARELLNASPSVGEVWRDDGALADRVGAADGAAARMRVVVDALAEHLHSAAPVDPVVRAAALGLAYPGARVGAVGEGLGDRQLRRRFDAAVGYSPKTLAGILRLQRFLALARNGTEPFLAAPARKGSVPDLARLALDAGYADQSHLTRECRRLTGLTPAALLAEGAGPAGEPSLTPS
jgi:AraC-like DNA-binding protein